MMVVQHLSPPPEHAPHLAPPMTPLRGVALLTAPGPAQTPARQVRRSYEALPLPAVAEAPLVASW